MTKDHGGHWPLQRIWITDLVQAKCSHSLQLGPHGSHKKNVLIPVRGQISLQLVSTRTQQQVLAQIAAQSTVRSDFSSKFYSVKAEHANGQKLQVASLGNLLHCLIILKMQLFFPLSVFLFQSEHPLLQFTNMNSYTLAAHYSERPGSFFYHNLLTHWQVAWSTGSFLSSIMNKSDPLHLSSELMYLHNLFSLP